MRFRLESCCFSETGLVRSENQDACLVHSADDISVFCVADGMGGHNNGKRASAEIVSGIREWTEGFYEKKYEMEFLRILDGFEEKLSAVNKRIYKCYNMGAICGSTLVVLLIYHENYVVYSVGDSRVYRKRGFSFQQITKDDTWQYSDHIPVGLSEQELRLHTSYDKLTRAFGTQESVVPQRITDKLKAGDVFLLCSDGVYKYCDSKVLDAACSRGFLGEKSVLDEKLRLIQESVLKRGAPDNLTAVLVRASRG